MEILFSEYENTSALTRCFLSLILFFAATLLTRFYKEGLQKKSLRLFQAMPLILIIKDIAYILFHLDWLLPLADNLVILLYYIYLILATVKIKFDRFYLAAVPVFFLLIPLHYNGDSAEKAYTAFLVINSIFLMRRFYRFRDREKSPESLAASAAAPAFIVYSASALIAGYSSFLMIVFIMPALFILHFFVLFIHAVSGFKHVMRKASLLKEEKSSISDFFSIISTVMMEKKDIDDSNNYTIRLITEKIKADSGAILLYDDLSDMLYVSAEAGVFVIPGIAKKTVKPLENAHTASNLKHVYVREGTILDSAFRDNKDIFIQDTFRMKYDSGFKDNIKNNIYFISSIIIIPLRVNGRAAGLICLEQNHPGKNFSADDYNILKSLAVYAEMMLASIAAHRELLEKKELERDISLSREIQKSLLPSKIPCSDKFAFGVYSKPARYVSGDYYDFISLDSGKVAFLVCDVAGKGVAAGLVMSVIRTIVHLTAEKEWHPSTVLETINAGIYKIGGDHFATAILFIYDPATEILEYANAAHLPGILLKSDDTIQQLDAEGLPIGIDKKSEYGWSRVSLARGDILCLYTDGINEAMNKGREQFGRERLISIIRDNSSLEAPEIVPKVIKSIDLFGGETQPHDDQTLMILKIN